MSWNYLAGCFFETNMVWFINDWKDRMYETVFCETGYGLALVKEKSLAHVVFDIENWMLLKIIGYFY